MKSAPRAPTSGIPLPHSLLPSSPKADLRRRTSNQPRASTESPKHMPSQTPVHSPSPCQQTSGIPAFFSRDHSLKSQLFQRTGGLPVPQTSRSAYSSPITQRRIPPPHSKDTLDLGKPTSTLTHTHFQQDGNRNTYINKNQTLGATSLRPQLQFRRVLNSNTVSASSEGTSVRDREPPTQTSLFNDGNLRTYHSQTKSSYEPVKRDRSDSMSQSDEEMRTPEDSSPASSPTPLPPLPMAFNMTFLSTTAANKQAQEEDDASTDTNPLKVNMATVAPYSFR